MFALGFCQRFLIVATTLSILVGSQAHRAVAEEPARAFLEALREEALFDLANEYLQRMEKNPATPQEFRDTILFEQGLTLMAVSRGESDYDKRQQRLDEAQSKFREFLTAQKNHDFAPKAKSQLANVLVERARVKISEANRAKNAADKPKIMKEARAFFEQALKEYEGSQEGIKKKLESLPKVLDPKRDEKRIEYRTELRSDYIQVQMVQAVILYEMSETATDTKDKNALLKRAADKYGELATKYRRMLAGLYSLLQQGKCYQEMGGEKNINQALTYYDELLDQPEEPKPFRVIRTKTLVQALQCWLSPEIKEKKIDTAALKANEWVAKIRPDEYKDSDWLQLHYELSRAYSMKIAGLDEREPDRKIAMKEALKLVDHGIKYSDDPLKTQFLELKANLGGKVETPDEKPDPQNFAEAYAAGVEAWKAITNGTAQIEILKGRLGKVKDEATKAEIEKQIDEASATMVDARFDAIDYFRRALGFVEPDTSMDELNLCRFYLCSLHWTQKDYLEAAVYGEYVARYFPGHRTAKYCAIYARASYQNLYNDAAERERKFKDALDKKKQLGSDDVSDSPATIAFLRAIESEKKFDSDGIIRVSRLMLEKWPGEPEADESLLVLIKFMVIQKNLPEAKKYLAMVPLDSATRGDAEIATGQAMWSTYLTDIKPIRAMEKENIAWQRDIKLWQGGEQPPEGASIEQRQKAIEENRAKITALQKELEPLKVESQQTLKDGIERMKQAEVDRTLAAAVASLSRIYVEADQAQDAIKLLEDPKIGALTLVKAKHPAVEREGVPAEIYTTALLAYFTALPDAPNPQELFKRAEAAMDGLNNTVGKDEEGQQRLIGIYYTLASQVKDLLDVAPPAKRKALTQVFATFLDRVAKTSDDFPVLGWVAENFYKLGEANDPGVGEPPADVKAFYGKAAEQYQKLLDKAKTDNTITDNMVVQLRVRLASVLRRQGQYLLAMNQMEEVLKDPKRNSMLDLQVAAAETYMDWAESELGIDRLYLRAVNGGRKNSKRKNNIWGWVLISKRLGAQVERSPELKDKFYETLHHAKINEATSHYKYALAAEGDEREKYLKYAKQDIFLASQSYPDLGGSATRAEYDKLLREVQAALKIDVVGLEEFQKAEPEAVAATPEAESEGGGGE